MGVEVSIVIPCLNEEETLGVCIRKAQQAREDLGIEREIITSDNGSVNWSIEIAQALPVSLNPNRVWNFGWGLSCSSQIHAESHRSPNDLLVVLL